MATGRRCRLAISLTAAAALVLAACAADDAGGGTAEQHFADATVYLSVPVNPGGGYDQYARMLAPYLAGELGAAQVVVENSPEAGGLVALNELYQDSTKGLRLALMNGVGTAGAALAEADGVGFEMERFAYVGRLVAEDNVWVVGSRSGMGDLDDALNHGAFRFGAIGPGASNYVFPVLLSAALDMADVSIIAGFESGAETELAVTRGDVDGMVGVVPSRIAAIEDGDHIAILSLSSTELSELPGVAALGELDLPPEQAAVAQGLVSLIALGRPLAAAPDVPDDHLDHLRRAFDRAISDPELVAEATAAQRPLTPLTGEQMQELVTAVLDAPDAFRAALVAAY